MKVEFLKENSFSSEPCIKLIAENQAEEVVLGNFFEESLDMGDADYITDTPTKSGLGDVTIYKKI